MTSLFETRSGTAVVIVALTVLASVSVLAQRARDRRFGTDQPADQILYVQSPEAMKRIVLSYDGLAADVYWIRALQQFGRDRRLPDTPTESLYAQQFPLLSGAAAFPVPLVHSARYALLYPLLDMATTLDPYFNIAYRFGAIFLSESPPGGPGRPDLAIALLEKGIKSSPEKWQYYQDAGFVNYWARRDFVTAAKWFERASHISGSPWWLKTLAANTLAIGGSREASRTLYRAMAESSENDFMRKDSARRLRQLDAMDYMDALSGIVTKYRAAGGSAPFTWAALVRAGLVRTAPRDPDGFPFALSPAEGRVSLDPSSTLNPLPTEPPASSSPASSSRPPAGPSA